MSEMRHYTKYFLTEPELTGSGNGTPSVSDKVPLDKAWLQDMGPHN